MKKFTDFLTESTKTYQFKLTIAGDVDAERAEKIRAALERFDVAKFGKVITLPIQHHPEFVAVGPTAVSMIDVETAYPATTEQIESAITSAGACAGLRFNVKTPIQLANEAPAAAEPQTEEPALLTKTELESVDAKDLYFDSQIATLLDEFKSMAREYGGPKGDRAKTTNDEAQNNTSAISGRTK
jgi:hypothetical protein